MPPTARRSAPWSTDRAGSRVLLHLPGGRHTAEAVRDALVQATGHLPAHLRRSLTWDQGKEMALHAEIAQTLGMLLGVALFGGGEVEVHLSVALGSIEQDVGQARKMTAEAIQKQQQAATESRRVVRELRNAGLSVADTAAVMEVSKGRISQLIS